MKIAIETGNADQRWKLLNIAKHVPRVGEKTTVEFGSIRVVTDVFYDFTEDIIFVSTKRWIKK